MNAPDPIVLASLQIVRLKGRVTRDALSGSLQLDPQRSEQIADGLVNDGWASAVGAALRITPAGRETLQQWSAAERRQVDLAALEEAYHAFDVINRHFKQLVADWQLRDGQPNDHSDAEYDNTILDRLDALDAEFAPLLARIVALAPRLAHYPARLGGALEKLRSGDTSWLARPISDSYHTVWFELHEDLIGLLGLSRLEEALAGRAE